MRTKKKKEKKKKIINMKKFEKLTENDISKIVKTLLKEDLSTLPFETISNNFPDNLDGTDFFSKVIPKIYEKSQIDL